MNPPATIRPSNFNAQCSVVVGKHSHVSLPNADVVVRPSTVERIAKVPLGVRVIGSGAVPRTPKTMAIITIITGREGPALGMSGIAEHLRWQQRPLVEQSREGQNDGPTGTDREQSSAPSRTEIPCRGLDPFAIMLERM